MQAVIAIPEFSVLRNFADADAEGVMTREVCGVPLLVRAIATAMRAGVDSLLVIWPPDVEQSIWTRCAASPLLRALQITKLVRPFDPRQPDNWDAIALSLEEQFLWLPWNWVTHKRALTGLPALAIQPATWDVPALLKKRAATCRARVQLSASLREGLSITSRGGTAAAEWFLVAHSGKASDGIYSKFNRLLCRPAVRLLTHTPVTPNAITVGGLGVAILAAFMYSRGYYAAYVAGALLFFLSGLFDEADGMLARIRFRESVFGTWFEGFVDEATYLLVFSGITIGLYRERGPAELTFGYLLIIGCVLSVVVTRLQRKLATAPDRPQEYAGRLNHLLESDSSNIVSRVVRQIHIFIKKGVAIHYLLIFTILGGLPLLLRLAALGANLTWLLALYFNRRFFRRPRTGTAGAEAQTARGDTMKAIILAAGQGTRIRAAHGECPKCLIRIDGTGWTILDQQIEALFQAGVADIGIVVGYERDQIIGHVRRNYRRSLDRFHFIENQAFADTNNIYSLWMARAWLKGSSFAVLNADVAFDPRILPPALSSAAPITMIVDPAWRDETMKVVIAGNRIVRMSKQISPDDFSATYIGITVVRAAAYQRLFNRIEYLIGAGDEKVFFNAAVQRLADEGLHVAASGTGGLPWAEIDDPGDLAFARLNVFPSLAPVAAAA